MQPRKRRRIDTKTTSYRCYEDVLGEIDLEILLRQQFAATLESRITWALLVQESIAKHALQSSTSFKDVALASIASVERPLNLLLARDIFPKKSEWTRSALRFTRPPPKEKIYVPRNSKGSFLYISSHNNHDILPEDGAQAYILRCPSCLRSNFTSLQGLLNHARISHSLEWGTHEDCIRACAVSDPSVDFTSGIEVGLGPTGILPGLRSLFQRAVGLKDGLGAKQADLGRSSQPSQESSQDASAILTKTLGLHQDTPALAPFLGKSAIRRGIRVCEDDEESIDIHSVTEPIMASNINPALRTHKGNWRMSYTHRNTFDEVHRGAKFSSKSYSAEGKPEGPLENQPSHRKPSLSNTSLPTSRSRFHFSARITIADHSCWIPPEDRISSDTHKWMISVESASYSHHITSILRRIIVSSTPESACSPASLMRAEPPFAVVGTTSQPFLARVELTFNGLSGFDDKRSDQKTVLEHWVELDLLKTGRIALGDEQVVDIELDKNTAISAPRTDYLPINSKILWSIEAATKSEREPSHEQSTLPSSVSSYEDILRRLSREFPMTLHDAGAGPVPTVSYRLVATPADLGSLVQGRRKAIEWARARTIQQAYTLAIRDHESGNRILPSLNTGDVYAWLSDNGRFIDIRDGIARRRDFGDKPIGGQLMTHWCSVCGRYRASHHDVSAPKVECDSESHGFGAHRIQNGLDCQITPPEFHFRTPPMVDIDELLRDASRVVHGPDRSAITTPIAAKDLPALIQAPDPHFVVSVSDAISSLHLPTFSTSCAPGKTFAPSSVMTKERLEAQISPYAVLAIAAKSFIKVLVKGGLNVITDESPIISGSVVWRGQKKRSKKDAILLTPSHILRGAIQMSQSDVSTLGVLLRHGVLVAKDNEPQVLQHASPRRIKTEEL